MTSPSMVVPVPEERIDEAAGVLARALADDPFFVYVMPDESTRVEKLTVLMKADVRFAHLFGEALTTAGTVAGAASWTPPGVNITPEGAKAAGFDRIGVALEPDELRRFGSVIDFLQPHAARAVDGDCWYLSAVGVEPSLRRTGIGRALLEPIVARADADGYPCSLNTFQPDNIPFYRALGFEVAVEEVEPESGLRFWMFARPPR